MSVKVRSRLFYRQQGKKSATFAEAMADRPMAILSAWYRVNPQTDSGTVQPSAAKPKAALMAFYDRISDVAGHSLARVSFNSSSEKVVRKQYSA